jgi:hypothetical protein
MTLGTLFAVFLGLVASASAGPPINGPSPWDELLWGMTLSEVQEIFPELEPFVPPGAQMSEEPSEVAKLINLDLQVLWDRSFESIEGCRVFVNMLGGTLYRLDFKCKEADPEQIQRVLENRYGFPRPGRAQDLKWSAKRTTVTLNTRSGQFALMDRRAGQKLSLSGFAQYLRGGAAVKPQNGSPEAAEGSGGPEASPEPPETSPGPTPPEGTSQSAPERGGEEQ